MNEQELIGRKLPYTLPEGSLDRLRDRIPSQPAGAGEHRHPARLRWRCIAGAAAVLLAGAILGLCLERRTLDSPDLDALLTTAPAETLRQAAALNYDDILYDQQL